MAASLTVEQRLDRLEAIEAARSVVARYCDAVDQGRTREALGPYFAENAVLRNPAGVTNGRDAILEYYDGFFASGATLSRHHLANQRFTALDGGRVRHEAYFLVLLARGGESFVGMGDYDDVLEHDGEAWRFVEKGNAVIGMVPLAEGWGAIAR
jgi:hypothetical protein